MIRSLASLVLVLPALAQAPTDPRAFVPRDYPCEVFVDFVALRQSGLWDHLQRSFVVNLVSSRSDHFGAMLPDLDRVRVFPETVGGDPATRIGRVLVLEGAEHVRLPAVSEQEHLRADTLAGHDVRIEDWGWNQTNPDVWVSPRPGLLVCAGQSFVTPVLEGKATPGVPPPEFLSLTSGRGGLAHLVVQMSPAMLEDMPAELRGMNPAPDDDALSHLMLRVRQVGDGDGITFELQGTLRFARGDVAPAKAAQWLRDQLQLLQQHRQYGALKRLWSKVEVTVDGQDVVARLGLGAARTAAAELGNSLASLVFMTVRAVETVGAQQAQVIVLPAVEEKPKPAAQPAGGKKDGG